MVEEKIVTIVGVEYIVSSDAHIYSTHNIGQGKYHKEIKQRKNKDGYMVVTVGPNSFRTTRRVARIVAEAFVPNPNNLPEVDHIDDVRDHDDASNLQWVTHQENVEKIPFERGSQARRGEHNGRSTISDEIVLEIRHRYENDNEKVSDLSKSFNMPYSTIFNIVHYKTWKHLDTSATTIESVTSKKNTCE